MSDSVDYWRSGRDPRAESDKAWKRSLAIAWDAQWQNLSTASRLAYLTQIKGVAREGSRVQGSTPATRVSPRVLEELVAAGFVEVQEPSGKKAGRILPIAATHDFSTRIRTIHRAQLLGKTSRESLTKYIKHTFFGQGESIIGRVLGKAGIQEYTRIDESLENYVTTHRWPAWAASMVDLPVARTLLQALIQAPGPVPLANLPVLVPSAKPAEIDKALEELIAHLVVFEDLDPKSWQILVGLLPIVREKLLEADKPRTRPPLVVVEKPTDFSPQSGTIVNDLRVFLLEIASESPRLRQDGGVFTREVPRLQAALSPWPDWLHKTLQTTDEDRVSLAHSYASRFGFVKIEKDEKQVTLGLSGKGRNWLGSGLEQQYAEIYESIRAYGKSKDRHDYSHDTTYNDLLFTGIALSVIPTIGKQSLYYHSYHEFKPEHRQAQRDAIEKSLGALQVGVFYLWQSVLDHLCFETHNPLFEGRDPSKLNIYFHQRLVPGLPERREQAGKALLSGMLRVRFLPFDAFQAAVDDQGRLCVARLPRLDGYFGRKYDTGETDRARVARVIVQPDFSVVVIGLDPAPAAELAPFCERTKGHLGEGAITFRITRDSVTRASSQGLSASAIVARLKKHASVDVPDNVLKEIREWAGWIRLVNVRQVTVVRCPDTDSVSRVVSALGKKAERLGGTLVALHVPKLNAADREKLQSQGILITKDDITPTSPADAAATSSAPTVTPSKKRGRPKKAR